MRIKSFLRKASASVILLPALALGVSVFVPSATEAADCTYDSIAGGAECAKPKDAATNLFGENSVFQTLTNIALFLIGAISVIMLIVGGVQYVLSGGDQASVTKAKNTILYAIIGIIIAFLAYAAVNFVITQLTQGTRG